MTYQKVTGPLMANSHPGSYCGQDAYSDMLVTDDGMVLCDEESGCNHIFSYHLYGDRVELGYHNNMIVLIKSE
jgi:hypothetical protein